MRKDQQQAGQICSASAPQLNGEQVGPMGPASLTPCDRQEQLEAAAIRAHARGLTMEQFEREHPGMLRCEEPTSMAVLVTAWLRLCALVNTGKVDESMALPE